MPDHAVAQPPLQRAERLPFQPVDRIAGRMRLRDRVPASSCPSCRRGIGAGEIELALPLLEQIAAARDERREPRIVAGAIGMPRDCWAT